MNIYILSSAMAIELAESKPGRGLTANVGQTTRPVSERIKDSDYSRKTPGGRWVIITEFNDTQITDSDVHKFLKDHPRVKWDDENPNTEEFTFLDDDGSGNEAVKIVSSFMQENDLKLLKREYKRLKKSFDQLTEENQRMSQNDTKHVSLALEKSETKNRYLIDQLAKEKEQVTTLKNLVSEIRAEKNKDIFSLKEIYTSQLAKEKKQVTLLKNLISELRVENIEVSSLREDDTELKKSLHSSMEELEHLKQTSESNKNYYISLIKSANKEILDLKSQKSLLLSFTTLLGILLVCSLLYFFAH